MLVRRAAGRLPARHVRGRRRRGRTAPARHLELRAPDLEAAQAALPNRGPDELELHAAERRGHAIAYAKRRETVHDLLVHIGAQHAVLSLDEAEVVARTAERANRLTNCDRANLGRSSAAAHRQREAIAQLDLAVVSDPLREVAELRLAHPRLLAGRARRAGTPAVAQIDGRPAYAYASFAHRSLTDSS